MNIPPEQFAAVVAERIKRNDYDALFTQGCCFHFAIRAFAKCLGNLVCLESTYDKTRIGHVFVLSPKGTAFDHKGYRQLNELKREFFPIGLLPHREVSKTEVIDVIEDQKLPRKLVEEIFRIADDIIEEKAQQTGAVNPHASGPSGVSPAEQARMQEASGIGRWA